jgi:hypothetical protein
MAMAWPSAGQKDSATPMEPIFTAQHRPFLRRGLPDQKAVTAAPGPEDGLEIFWRAGAGRELWVTSMPSGIPSRGILTSRKESSGIKSPIHL